MNKKGGMYLGIVFFIFFFMTGMLIIPFIKDNITGARDNIQCTNSSISSGTKMTCLVIDTGVPYFIITILALAGGFIGNEL